ncbi:MAG: glutathione S-transferase [Actinomycetota bacterium]|nr:glutathione S-transferase [Actinomycetota bacterium]
MLTAQLMLAYKGISYRRVNLPPGAHALIMLGLGFETMTVPGLKVGARRVQGTRYIARFLDELVPEPALFPAEPERRLAVQEAERWGEAFQNSIRRIAYCICRRDPNAFRAVILAERSFPMRAILGLATPLIIRLATAKHDAVDAAGRDDVAELPARLDQIDAWIEEGLLGGPELNAADFQIAPNLALLLMSEDAVPFVVGRPAEKLARRVAPGYTGSVGKALSDATIPKALPADWLPAVDLGTAGR